MNLNDLKRPFPVNRLSFRVGSITKDKSKGMALAYLDARDVMVRFDEVCGAAHWQARYPWSDGQKMCCEIGVDVPDVVQNRIAHDDHTIEIVDEFHYRDNWIWKSNGAGDTQVEADKGAFSDAFKRAAVLWGVGQYLYSAPNSWYELDQYKKFTPNALAAIKIDFQEWQATIGSTLTEQLQVSRLAILEGLDEEDYNKVGEAIQELNHLEKESIWMEFNTKQKAKIREFLQQHAKQESKDE